jgi:SDR family mycofactocin-dependent oxidoreductase
MAKSLEDKVAFITGAAQGQGRSHAVRLAREGADIIALDLCHQIESVHHPMGTPEALAETVSLVQGEGRRIVARQADVRDYDSVKAIVDEGLAELGHIDIVCANAGIVGQDADVSGWQIPAQRWQDIIDVDLTGVWHTLKAVCPPMIDRGEGGAVVITSSSAGIKGMSHLADYAAAKHGLVGLMRTFAIELAPHRIRVNTVHPTGVKTPMIQNSSMEGFLASDRVVSVPNLLPVDAVEASDVTNAVVFLVSETGRYITGAMIPVDAGFTVR